MLKRFSVGGTSLLQKARGFTLMELMVVVVVVGILAAIAYPSYQEQVRKSRRSDAKNALADLASRQQQYFADNKTYASTTGALGWKADGKSQEGYYSLAITIPAAAIISGVNTAYVLTATATGAQSSDTKCATFSLTSAGKKTSTGSSINCW